MSRDPVQPRGLADTQARQRIVSAARHHFLTHGFRGVTMADLAEALGMSKKTLYIHFTSKTGLLQAVLLDKFHSVEEDLERITAQNALDFPTALHHLLACVQGHTDEIKAPFLRDLQREAPEMFALVERRRREVIQPCFTRLLEEGRREGLIRQDVSVALMVEILLGATQAIMNPPRLAELGLTPTTGFTAILTVILEGALTQKGKVRP